MTVGQSLAVASKSMILSFNFGYLKIFKVPRSTTITTYLFSFKKVNCLFINGQISVKLMIYSSYLCHDIYF